MARENPASVYEGVLAIEAPVIQKVEAALRSRSLTTWQMAFLARAGASDFGFSMSWSAILEPYAHRGVNLDDPDELDLWEETRDLFYETFGAEFAAFCKSFDNQPTKFNQLHSILVQRDDPLYWMVSPDVLVSGLLKAGKFGFYTGPPGSGKSDYSFRTIEGIANLWENHLEHRRDPKLGPSRLTRIDNSLNRRNAADPMAQPEEDESERDMGMPQSRRKDLVSAKDFRVLVNTQFGPGHPFSKYVQYCPSLSSYHLGADQSALDEALNLQIIDEYGASADRGVQNKKKRDLERYARRVRKNWGVLLYISQDEGDLTPWIANWLDTRIEFGEDHDMTASISRTPYAFKKIRGVWRTTMPYNSASHSSVVADIEEDKYADAMGEIEQAIGFDDPVANEREMHHASMKWIRENIRKEAFTRHDEDQKRRPRRDPDEDDP